MSSNDYLDDPRLTTYVLGELSPSEREQVEALLRDNESARRAVEEIRATTALLSSELQAQSSEATLTDAQRRTIAASAARPVRSRFAIRVAAGLAAAAMIGVTVSAFLPTLNRAREVHVPRETYAIADPSEPPAATTIPPQTQPSSGTPSAGTIVRRADLSVEAEARFDPKVFASLQAAKSISHFSNGRYIWDSQAGKIDSNDSVLIPSGPHNTEAYDRITDNAFLEVAQNPLSTFSIDVDTASYSNIRRFIYEMSQLPPKDAVRIEEMINYFPYSYPAPTGDAPFGESVEVAGCPWNAQHRLVRIALKGKEIAKEKRPPSNLVFLIDVSGSMQPANKLPLLKSAMQRLVRELGENDRVAIVVYAGSSGLALPSTTCDSSNQQKILDALQQLTSGGSTNGAEGIQLAYQVAAQNFIRDGTNRVILCTDGDFNVGVTNQGDLTRLIEEKAKANVFLSVLGFGMGNVKDSTMEKLADKGNGNYAYIDTAREGQKVLVEQMSGTLITIAKDVKIQVEFNPAKVSGYRLIGYENRLLAKEDFNDDKKDAGEIGAGHTVTALYEIVPAGVKVDAPAVDRLKYQDQPKVDAPKRADSDELLTVKLRYKSPDAALEQGTSKLLEFPAKDGGASYANASKDFKFASAVAAYGMILRDSPHKGATTLDAVIELAQEGAGEDRAGYRGEFIELVRKTKTLSGGK